MVNPVAQDNFKKEVTEHKGVVFVDFYADWCGPCKITGPVIDELSDERKDIKFVKVDVDKNPQLVSSYSIFSIPTFLIIKDGRIVSQFVGAVAKENLVEEINKVAKKLSS